MLTVAGKITPLIDFLKQKLLSGPLIHIDETQMQVLNEPGKTAQSKSYMRVQRSGPPDTPAVYFLYAPSRATNVPDKLLKGCACGDRVTKMQRKSTRIGTYSATSAASLSPSRSVLSLNLRPSKCTCGCRQYSSSLQARSALVLTSCIRRIRATAGV